ncbi:TPA: class I SAM-dependent methyltransferase [Candidatus Micrarchaeota archaeon]|nr:class I SAM-dependent methyltransferase [Candidatus Micrarchaeota archaeon]
MANSSAAWNKAYASNRIQWRGGQRLDLKIPEGSRVLEVGCGNGKTIVSLLGMNVQLHAIDFSTVAIQQAKEFVAQAGKQCDFSVQDVCKMDFEDGFFDFVLCIHVLGHLTPLQRKKAVSEMLRVSKPGGTLYLRDFTVNDFRCGKGTETAPNTFARKGIATHYFTEEEMALLLADCKIVSLNPISWKVTYDRKTYPRQEIGVLVEK